MPKTCFYAMPFNAQSHYVYLFVKSIVESQFDVIITRADDAQYLSSEIIAKIQQHVNNCDFAIADLSGNNANVLYEVGLLHAKNSDIIFVSGELPAAAPFDVNSFPIYSYHGMDHEHFQARLVEAVSWQVNGKYYEFRRITESLIKRYNAAHGTDYSMIGEERFSQLIDNALRSGMYVHAPHPGLEIIHHLIPDVIEGRQPTELGFAFSEWLKREQH